MTADPIAAGCAWLEQALALAGFKTTVAVVESPLAGVVPGYWLEIDRRLLSTAQIEALLANNAQALDALQYLLNATLNLGRSREEQTAFTLELAGYRRARYRQLQEIAHRVATQVLDTGKPIEIRSLSAAERRVVHSLIKVESDRLETFSYGEEPDRRLVVQLSQGTEAEVAADALEQV
ncbi:RNA-binding protein [Thermosynechococcus sichuanensis E542]|uniref:RNA-binding protein n=1 Tax=Thermosynechococcus sichuanensis E542 TaxID=2016101 RepID=A0A3B7MEC2_9CYAN|nr:R3H domain-containing nucleic acid-binding protein [Thermosynechococcus vestitus]AXY67751.1 RNA-binding protein [Thermosynechococcus vestitus E542]